MKEQKVMNRQITNRLLTIDLLRGLAMIFMVLDHTRDYFGPTPFNPLLDVTQTNWELFLTRFIANLAAPIFIFLTGVSAFLYKEKIKSNAELSHYLVTRGGFLIFLELTVVKLGWTMHFIPIDLQVIWAIGCSMLILAAVIRLPLLVIGLIAVVIIAGHNLLDFIHVGSDSNFTTIVYSILHQTNEWQFSRYFSMEIEYPLLPWPGVMMLGYVFGKYIHKLLEPKNRTFIWLGSGCLAVFAGLRYFNFYGDPNPFRHYSDFIQTAFSFFANTKYPASLQYLLLTLGIIFIAIPFLNKCNQNKFILTFGRVPLFFYLIHVPIIYLLADIYSAIIYHRTYWWFHAPETWPANYHFSLGLVYLVWAVVLLITYPLCRWYGNYKFNGPKKKWLKYL